jgi:hypothetical protein
MDSEEKKYTAKDLYIAFIVRGIFQKSQAGTPAEAWKEAVRKGLSAAQRSAEVSDFEQRFDAAKRALDGDGQ